MREGKSRASLVQRAPGPQCCTQQAPTRAGAGRLPQGAPPVHAYIHQHTHIPLCAPYVQTLCTHTGYTGRGGTHLHSPLSIHDPYIHPDTHLCPQCPGQEGAVGRSPGPKPNSFISAPVLSPPRWLKLTSKDSGRLLAMSSTPGCCGLPGTGPARLDMRGRFPS